MNTKGIKFLAVLAVMAMAFAAVLVLAPADNGNEAIVVYGNDDVVVDPTVINDSVTATQFYISDDATVKIKALKADVTFYVQNGKELELDFRASTDTSSAGVAKKVTIYSVTGDQQRDTTSTFNQSTSTSIEHGKIIIEASKLQFTGADKQNVVYVAMMPKTVETTTTSTSITAFETNVVITKKYATISASEELKDAVAGDNVTIASGQSIDTKANLDNINYGVVFKDKGVMNTYYAPGMNAGSITVGSEDSVVIKDGSAIVINGTANVKASAVKGDKTVTVEYGAEDQLNISQTIKSGTMSASGKVKFTSFKIKTDATVTLNSNAEVITGSEITVDGKLILKNDNEDSQNLVVKGEGFIVAENEKLWFYTGGTKPVLKFATGSTFSGQYDVSAINKSADVYDSFSNAMIEKNQTFRMIGDTVIANEFIIEGILIIEPDVTLTITQTNNYGASVTIQGQYAQIINHGTIVVKTTTPYEGTLIGVHIYGGTLLNYGTINATSASGAAGNETFEVDYLTDDEYEEKEIVGVTAGGFGVVNEGAISIGKHDTADLDDNFTNAKKGSVTVNGTFYGTNFVNKGSFTLSSAKISDNLNVAMSAGSVFVINSVDMTQGKTITIQNNSGANAIAITAPGDNTAADADKVRVTGWTVVDTSITSMSMYNLDVSGSVGTSIPSSIVENPVVTIATKGYIDVTGSFTIGKGYTLNLNEATTFTVYGTVNINEKVTATADASKLIMPVYGTVTDYSKKLGEGKVSYVGAWYATSNADIYTTLENAIPAAVEAEVPEINVRSDEASLTPVIVTDDIIVPEGLTVNGNFLAVDEKASIIVESGARFSFEAIVIKDGLISAADINDIDYDEILADVKVADEDSTAAACMSLEVALMLASPGDVIELSNAYYTADATLEIPAGITVNATAVEGTAFVMVNSDLVVNGNLIVDQFAFVATTDDTIGITVDGFIYDKCSNGACFVDWWYTPFGVSYFQTDDEDHTWYVLTTFDNLQPAINVADDAKVWVEGDATFGDITVTGRDDMPAEVIFKGNVDAGTVTITDTALEFTDGKEITITVKDAIGSITITGAYSDADLTIFSLDDEGVYMAGVVTDTATPTVADSSISTYSIRFDGVTGMDGTTKTVIDWTNDEKYPTILFAGETTVIGKKAKINSDDENTTGIATITGTLYVDNNSKLIINCDAQILGILAAAERTDEAPATIEINGDIFVGMLKSDIYYEALGADAVLSGKIVLAQKCFIYKAPSATVDESIIEDLDSMNLYIDNVIWFTVYGYKNDNFSLNGLMVPMENAEIYSILDENYNVVADWFGSIIVGSVSKPLADYENVYITLDYEIFTVKIKTDGSVKAVYIDGILMETGESKNIFLMRDVAAGTHKVSVEAATGYDADKCVLYTELGTILPGLAFTFTQYDCTEEIDGESTVVYNINGTEIQPEPVPPTPEEESQWTVTTILLVILVVLIAIMAVIVALRLNRS